MFRTVKTDADKETLQDDLTKLVKWSEQLQMLFNFGKCKCIHIGHGNVSEECFMDNRHTHAMGAAETLQLYVYL